MNDEKRFEFEMISPIRSALSQQLHLDVVSTEFSAGYGVADLVGAKLCPDGVRMRQNSGTMDAIDKKLLVRVLMAIRRDRRTSVNAILGKLAISESTLKKKVLPQLDRAGIIDRVSPNFVSLVSDVPNPMKQIIAVEAKQTKWREAIIQARRYGYFANKSYIAIWSEKIRSIDRNLLYRHRLGLISVTDGGADIVVEAPLRAPRVRYMHRYCAEYLYGILLQRLDQQADMELLK